MGSQLHTETVAIRPHDEACEPQTRLPAGPPPVQPPDDGDGERRPLHGPPNDLGLFGMKIALVSVSILFIGLGVAFYARAQTHINWSAVAVPNMFWLSTALICVSSYTLERARRDVLEDREEHLSRWLLRTVWLGLGFLASQVLGLMELVRGGFFMRSNPHSSLLYVSASTHGLHLLGGLIALGWLVHRTTRRAYAPSAVRAGTARAMSVTRLYWHFLTVLWIILFIWLAAWR